MKYIGIDPGINGGVAVIDSYYSIESRKCPKTTIEMAELIKNLVDDEAIAIIERVHSFPGQGVVSTFTFGTNYGQWQGILSALGIQYEFILPRMWQKVYQPLSKEKKDRKNQLKQLAKDKFPSEKVTLYTSDAILLALYLRESNHG